jgi:hypothetical protein
MAIPQPSKREKAMSKPPKKRSIPYDSRISIDISSEAIRILELSGGGKFLKMGSEPTTPECTHLPDSQNQTFIRSLSEVIKKAGQNCWDTG